MEQVDVDVAIVGAGPCGLTLARLLARSGVRSLILEKRTELHRAPQAHVVSARTMEIFGVMGLADRVRAAGSHPDRLLHIVWCNSLAGVEYGRLSLEDFDDTMVSASSLPDAVNIAQNVLEPILFEGIEESGHVRVCFGTAVVGVTQDAHSATVNVRGPQGEQQIRARFVIGADGAGSFVRKALGIELAGVAELGRFVNVHFRADLERYIAHRPGPLYWIFGARPGAIIAYDVQTNFVFMTPYFRNAEQPEDFDTARCAKLVRQAVGDPNLQMEIIGATTWIMASQVAQSYGKGRVYLVGDAAHRFPPTGGLGMNTGVADAFNLAWKLVRVIRGASSPDLLRSYEVERRPVAIRNAEHSTHNFKKMDDVARTLGLNPETVEKAKWLLEGPVGARLPRRWVRFLVETAASLGMRRLHRLQPSDPELHELRERMRVALRDQYGHFDATGLDLGHHYAQGCVLSDGTLPPVPADPVLNYIPSGVPGARLPLVKRDGGTRWAIELDPQLPTLVTFGGDERWSAACAAVREHEGGLHWVDLAASLSPAELDAYARVVGVSPGGALLLRPDAHIAARRARNTGDPSAWLTASLRSVDLLGALKATTITREATLP